jgi:hypothetical protein
MFIVNCIYGNEPTNMEVFKCWAGWVFFMSLLNVWADYAWERRMEDYRKQEMYKRTMRRW